MPMICMKMLNYDEYMMIWYYTVPIWTGRHTTVVGSLYPGRGLIHRSYLDGQLIHFAYVVRGWVRVRQFGLFSLYLTTWLWRFVLMSFFSLFPYFTVHALHTQYIFRTDPPFFGGCVSCRAGTPRWAEAIIEDVPAELASSTCSWSAAESEYVCYDVWLMLETLQTKSWV